MNSFRSLLNPLTSHIRHCRRLSQTPFADILPSSARVVVCGNGIVGNSVAYHLMEKGWTDVVIIDQEDGIGKGTSVYGSGILALLKPVEEQQIINKSIALYKKLQKDGHEIGLQECGSLYLAQNRERMILFRRRAALNQPQGIDCKIIGPREIEDIHPLVNTSDLQGGIYVEADVVANPVLLDTVFRVRWGGSWELSLIHRKNALFLMEDEIHVLAELAHKGGVRFVRNCQFLNLSTSNGRVSSVETSLGTIKCEYFVNCAGMWSWELGQKCTPKVRIPVHPAEHYYLLTESLNKTLPGVLPTIRDYDSGIYIRKLENNSFLMGGFEEVAKPVFTKGIPKNWKDCLSADWDHFAPLLDRCLHRAPILKECELKFLRNAPDNFTPDGKWILGEAPEIDNYFVAAGMNGNSLQGAGGIGHSLAHWITEGAADICLLEFDVRRFIDVHNNRRFLYERVKEVVGRQYAILFPFQTEYKTARKIRCSPLYATLKNQGAIFGNIMSFERPLFFNLEHEAGSNPELPPGTYWKPHFFENLKEEYKTCREGVAVIDMSSFSKFQIMSAKKEVVDFLQNLCSNDVDIPLGHVCPAGMHNEQGGYENDCMLIREQPNSYFMVAPTKQQTRIAEWMERHLPKNGYVQINDVTSMYTVLLIIGPKSREVLTQLIEDDIDLKMLPFTYQMVSLGHTPKTIKLVSVTNSGEPGYSLYIPSEYAVHVYDQLMKAGKDYGIKNAGYLTLRFLRLERFVPFWGEEMDSQTTPLEIGRSHRVKFDKGEFIGKTALLKQNESGLFRRLVHFTMDDDHDAENDVWMWGGEPIFRNGVYVGATTSGGYGFTLERMIALGFIVNKDYKTGQLLPVTNDYVMSKDALYQIDIAGRRFTVRQSLHPPRLPGSQPGTD